MAGFGANRGDGARSVSPTSLASVRPTASVARRTAEKVRARAERRPPVGLRAGEPEMGRSNKRPRDVEPDPSGDPIDQAADERMPRPGFARSAHRCRYRAGSRSFAGSRPRVLAAVGPASTLFPDAGIADDGQSGARREGMRPRLAQRLIGPIAWAEGPRQSGGGPAAAADAAAKGEPRSGKFELAAGIAGAREPRGGERAETKRYCEVEASCGRGCRRRGGDAIVPRGTCTQK